jgi:hypothetical protein
VPDDRTVVTTAVARPTRIATTTRPIGAAISRSIGKTAARPVGTAAGTQTGKAVVDMRAAVKTSAGSVIAAASIGTMMKAIADVSSAAKTTAADVGAAATTATTAAAAPPPRVAIIDDENECDYCQRNGCETLGNCRRCNGHEPLDPSYGFAAVRPPSPI